MQIKDMFRKKIDREIQGVIIVGQGEETNVAQELEEYVVTRELQRHFADFFAAYKKGIQGTTPKMGVWISGFFGSGKSHFLKILSYLLQNKQVGDKHAMASLKDDERVYIETTDIHEWFLKNAERYDNIRILKSKMENAIFEKLTDHFIIMTGSMAEGTQDRV